MMTPEQYEESRKKAEEYAKEHPEKVEKIRELLASVSDMQEYLDKHPRFNKHLIKGDYSGKPFALLPKRGIEEEVQSKAPKKDDDLPGIVVFGSLTIILIVVIIIVVVASSIAIFIFDAAGPFWFFLPAIIMVFGLLLSNRG